ncbi:MAG: arylsulfatase A-like enzyme [Verrucomicrobiales bacterium]|jgi:arylsulfatase A-like enzyme
MEFWRDDFRILLTSWLLGLGLMSGLAQDRPNILLIMADDLGYSDLGSYGGEIDTPHLNRLAANGLRFTDFYNTGRCCPSRASLLTGLYPHQTGMGWMTAADLQLPAYQGELNESSATIAEVLSSAGYGTYMTGKWHLTRYDHEQAQANKSSWPRQRGFDQFYGSMCGGNYFAPDTLTKDNERISPTSEGYFYTDAISAATQGYLQEHHKATTNKPLFCYVAYTAPHFPLHAPEQDIAKYRERYARGWDALRQERYDRMRQMRLLEPQWKLPPRPESVPAWGTV